MTVIMWLSRAHKSYVKKHLLDNGGHVESPAMYAETINQLLVGQLWHRDSPIVYTYATGSCEQHTTCLYIRIMCLCNLPLYRATYTCVNKLYSLLTQMYSLHLNKQFSPPKIKTNFRVTTTFITYNHRNSDTFPSIVIYNFFICGNIAFSIWRHVYRM